jgi:hypothetical protein
MSFDLSLIETGNGGDLKFKANDFETVTGIENMPYIAMFGGNLKESTTSTRKSESFDYWANNLLLNGKSKSIQYNSVTERVLNSTPLTSSGRVLIENAIKEDLKFFEEFGAKVTVNVEIVATDRIDVTIKIHLPAQVVVKVIKFKKSSDGDFSILDFNNDFY